MEEQKEYKEENTRENIKEVKVATKKGCAKKGKNPPKTRGGKCGSKKKSKRLISKKAIKDYFK